MFFNKLDRNNYSNIFGLTNLKIEGNFNSDSKSKGIILPNHEKDTGNLMIKKLFSRKNTPRIVLGVLSAVFFFEYIHLLEHSIKWHYNHPFVWPTWLLGLVTMEMAILYNHPLAIKIRRFLNMPSHIVSALYVSVSGMLMSLVHVGWNGCFQPGPQDFGCVENMLNVWTYFPMTSPSVEVILLSFRGFGGQDEVYMAVATFLMALGLVWILNVVTPKDIPTRQKVLSSVGLIVNAEAGFYWLYVMTKNTDSWPGAVLFLVLSILFVKLFWRPDVSGTN